MVFYRLDAIPVSSGVGVGPMGFDPMTDRCLPEGYEPVAFSELFVFSTRLSYGPTCSGA